MDGCRFNIALSGGRRPKSLLVLEPSVRFRSGFHTTRWTPAEGVPAYDPGGLLLGPLSALGIFLADILPLAIALNAAQVIKLSSAPRYVRGNRAGMPPSPPVMVGRSASVFARRQCGAGR